MTPDPSAVPLTVFVQAVEGPALDELRLIVFAVVAVGFVLGLLLASVLVTTGLRR